MPSVQLKQGDMFASPSDLIVLPCSTAGTITQFVRMRLVHHQIPYPTPGMELGDVEVLPFVGGENIAQFVAFAASVAANSSNLEAIERIGKRLGKETQKNPAIRLIAAPLLGTGAGGLECEAVTHALATGFKREAHPEAQLVLHVLDDKLFHCLSSTSRDSRAVGTKNKADVPGSLRVFISYCHTSPEHEKWVQDLGAFLRGSGVDARLDIWHLRRGMDLPQFMTNELTLAQRVILVSDERYAEKADGRVGGVGWETMIIQGDIAKLPPDSIKYLVIVRSKNIDDGLPHYLKTKFVIHWPGDISERGNRQILLGELFNTVSIPEIGPKPVFL